MQTVSAWFTDRHCEPTVFTGNHQDAIRTNIPSAWCSVVYRVCTSPQQAWPGVLLAVKCSSKCFGSLIVIENLSKSNYRLQNGVKKLSSAFAFHCKQSSKIIIHQWWPLGAYFLSISHLLTFWPETAPWSSSRDFNFSRKSIFHWLFKV